MNKIMKTTFTFLLLSVMIISGGCKKFLDRKPLGSATAGDLAAGGVDEKVFGLYGKLRDEGISGFALLWFKTIRSDDAAKGSTPNDAAAQGQIMDNFQYANGKDMWPFNDWWNGHYNFIYSCNDILHDIDSLQLNDQGSMINKGEASFMRAFAYFDLVRDYGEVPIVKNKIYQAGDANFPKSTVDQVYAFIEEDLQTAVQNLPLEWNAAFPGRVTKGTANTLLAKVYLYRKNWAGALARSEEVINSGLYKLTPNYIDYFKESGENNAESLFEIQQYVNANGSLVIANNFAIVQGVRGSGAWDFGWGFNVPTQNLVDAYEPNDPRKNATILFTGQPDGIYGLTLPADLLQPYWNKKIYSDPARRAATGMRFAQWMNVRLIRYADVLLMAAEAANETGNAAKAVDYLEMVRARARGGANILPKITTTNQAELRNAIKHERRVEFGMEYERFYDLVRWGDAITVLGPLGYQERNRYFPIPQGAIDRSKVDGVEVLKQNPDWK